MERLAQERKRSEELLCRMMPKAIADRLKLGGKAVETCEVKKKKDRNHFMRLLRSQYSLLRNHSFFNVDKGRDVFEQYLNLNEYMKDHIFELQKKI